MYWNIFRRYTMHTTWWPLSLWWPQLKGELRSNSAPSHWHRKGLARSKLLRPCLASRHGATLSQEWERAPYFGGGQTPHTISQMLLRIFGKFLPTRCYIMFSTKTRILFFNSRKTPGQVILFTKTFPDTRIYTKTFLTNYICICNRILTVTKFCRLTILWEQCVSNVKVS